jgi:hypothetical protein
MQKKVKFPNSKFQNISLISKKIIGISTKDEEMDLPSLYRIPKFYKCSYK